MIKRSKLRSARPREIPDDRRPIQIVLASNVRFFSRSRKLSPQALARLTALPLETVRAVLKGTHSRVTVKLVACLARVLDVEERALLDRRFRRSKLPQRAARSRAGKVGERDR